MQHMAHMRSPLPLWHILFVSSFCR